MIRKCALLALSVIPVLANIETATASQLTRQTNPNEPVAVEGVDLFAPNGFDSNDEVVVVLDGYLPNSCYRLTQADVSIDETAFEIEISQMARRFPGPCIVPLVPFTTVIEVGMLREGTYTVISNNGRLRTTMTVAKATTSGSYGPDDFLYAPVDYVSVAEDTAGNYAATISGRLTNSCMEFDQVKVIHNDRVIELLPILKDMSDENCVGEDRPYSRTVMLPKHLKTGRNLVHVRSLNGSSKNAVFSAK